MRKVTDAEFEYVAGPMQVGDEHPGQKGWFYAGRYDRKGTLLWYKPPSRLSWWIRRVALIIFWSFIAFGALVSFIVER